MRTDMMHFWKSRICLLIIHRATFLTTRRDSSWLNIATLRAVATEHNSSDGPSVIPNCDSSRKKHLSLTYVLINPLATVGAYRRSIHAARNV